MSRKSVTKAASTTTKRTRKCTKKRAILNGDELPMAEVEDTSPNIPQRNKMSTKLIFRKQYNFTDKQQDIIAAIMDKKNKVIFIEGPSGSSKSYISVLAALKLIDQKKVSHLVYVRSLAESASKSIGCLPGPQPLFAKILTPTGWSTMGEINKGDQVISIDGKPSEVLEIYPKGVKKIYKINTSDGRSTYCCDDHLWFTQSLSEYKLGKLGSVKTFKEIRESLYGSPDNKKFSKKLNHAIPFHDPVQYSEKQLPIPAYTLGALLGDGCFSGTTSIASSDFEIVDRINNELLEINCGLHINQFKKGEVNNMHIFSHVKNNKPSKKIQFTNLKSGKNIVFSSRKDCLEYFSDMTQNLFYNLKTGDIFEDYYVNILDTDVSTNPLKNGLIKLNLNDKRAVDKFIPEIYKTSSIQQRLDLLRGLMDTDGSNGGSCSYFYTISSQLAFDVIDIVRSLGGTTHIYISNKVGKKSELKGREFTTNHPLFEVRISLPESLNPFHLKRKSENYKRKFLHKIRIESYKEIGEFEAKCILIDNPSHLYLTDDYIVTHNTLGEKYTPFLLPLEEKLDEIIEKKSKEELYKQHRIEAIPINFLRGASINATCLIVDEAQNMTMKELTTAITRIGEFSKFIFIGDPMQSDINGKSGFKRMFNLFDSDRSESEGIKCFSFTKDDIVRSGILKFIAEVLEEDIEDQKHKNQYQEQPPRTKHPRSQENPPAQSIWNVSDPSQDFPTEEKNGVFNNVKTFFKKFAT